MSTLREIGPRTLVSILNLSARAYRLFTDRAYFVLLFGQKNPLLARGRKITLRHIFTIDKYSGIKDQPRKQMDLRVLKVTDKTMGHSQNNERMTAQTATVQFRLKIHLQTRSRQTLKPGVGRLLGILGTEGCATRSPNPDPFSDQT